MCVARVDEGSGDGSGPCVAVLVVAPGGEIRLAVVQGQLQVSRAVGEVVADDAALRVPETCDLLQVEGLPGAELHARPQYQRDAMPVFGQHTFDGGHRDRAIGFVGFELDQLSRRIEPVEADLRFHRIAVRGKGTSLDQDGGAPGNRAVKARHQQVQVERERVHRHHFTGLGTHQRGQAVTHAFVVGHPWRLAAEVRFHAKLRPVIEFLHQRGAHAPRLQAERVSAEIALLVLTMARNEELGAILAQGIGGIQGQGPGFVRVLCQWRVRCRKTIVGRHEFGSGWG